MYLKCSFYFYIKIAMYYTYINIIIISNIKAIIIKHNLMLCL